MAGNDSLVKGTPDGGSDRGALDGEPRHSVLVHPRIVHEDLALHLATLLCGEHEEAAQLREVAGSDGAVCGVGPELLSQLTVPEFGRVVGCPREKYCRID